MTLQGQCIFGCIKFVCLLCAGVTVIARDSDGDGVPNEFTLHTPAGSVGPAAL